VSPLTIYNSEGLPKHSAGPPGPPGNQGPMGPIGPTGPTGPAAPVRRYWRLFGDNSGDNTNTSNTIWSTVKSPVFTAPATGWYKVIANFGVYAGSNAVQMALAVMVDANVGQMFYTYGDQNEHQPIAITIPLQLTTNQKVTIGYRPAVSGKPMTLVNSNTIVPLLLIEEIGAPS